MLRKIGHAEISRSIALAPAIPQGNRFAIPSTYDGGTEIPTPFLPRKWKYGAKALFKLRTEWR